MLIHIILVLPLEWNMDHGRGFQNDLGNGSLTMCDRIIKLDLKVNEVNE